METIVFKIIISSSLLIAIYYLFLQREKMFRFNRFYLLFALVFSYAIPFVKINLPAISHQANKINFEETTQTLTYQTNEVSSFEWQFLLMMIYVVVATAILCKTVFSIFRILNIKGETIIHQGQKIKVMKDNLPPFSFWNKVYLSKNHFENQIIDNRIFLHEKTHIVQKHSLDLILIEILQAISWFNPAIYFYKKAITDNHEFLADEVIISKALNVKDYQKLILAEVLNVQNLSLINQFNFNNTKQRFIMMTTKKSKFENLKKLFAISVIAVSSFFFVQKVYASKTSENGFPKSEFQVDDSTKADTVLVIKDFKAENSKLKKSKKPAKPNDPSHLKENELPIPPPPPPARDFKNAEFPEGLNGLRRGIADAFDSSTFEGKGTIKSNLYITIDENGKTTDVRAEGDSQKFNEEAIKAMKIAIKDKIWKPATSEEKSVATVFQLPLTMQFVTNGK